MNTPKCYSYIRFSTPEQIKGNSLTRQLGKSREYANKHNLVLDEDLSYQDLGISAFTGDNRKKGSLGQFLQFVQNGKIPKGSVLIVESLDRLSREKVMDAFNMFSEIIKCGIRIVTLTDGMEYSEESIRDNFFQIIQSLVIMSRAHEESLIKSQRISAAWEHKRNNASLKIITGKCPDWLQPNNDKSAFIMILDRCESIRQIFIKKDEGKGKSLIARELNQSKFWKPKNGWRESYIEKILRSRAVIGEFQPHKFIEAKRVPFGEPIKGYFPKIVEDQIFYRIQNSLKKNIHHGGRCGKISNLFSYIAKCGYCGSPMAYLNKGYGEFLKCDNSRRALGCISRSVDYKQFEKIILTHTKGLDIVNILNINNENNICQINGIEKQVESIDGEKKYVKEQIDNLTKAISMTAYRKVQETYEESLNGLLENLNLLEIKQMELIEKKNELALKLENAISHFQIKELIDEIENSNDERRIDLRSKLRKALRSIYDFIDVYSDGDVIFKNETLDAKANRLRYSNQEYTIEYIKKHLNDFIKPQYYLMYKNGSYMVLHSNREHPLETEFNLKQKSYKVWIHDDSEGYLQIGD